MEKIVAIKKIVEEKQCAKVDGMMIDLFTASKIAVVYDNISEANREKYVSLPVEKMASMAYQLV